ncbi:MAG: hypothetical protein IPM47_08565 [Sphingobacteriales bacterium]|nr:MAG: hypothetical protein IPM47_08565 [Sphingobacteriales bacterium]
MKRKKRGIAAYRWQSSHSAKRLLCYLYASESLVEIGSLQPQWGLGQSPKEIFLKNTYIYLCKLEFSLYRR